MNETDLLEKLYEYVNQNGELTNFRENFLAAQHEIFITAEELDELYNNS